MLEHVDSDKGVTNVLLNQVCIDLCNFMRKRSDDATFIGVHNVDKLPKLNRDSHLVFVLNTANPSMGRYWGHFIVIYQNPADKYVLYLDPYGEPSTNSAVSNLLFSTNYPVFYNNRPIQHLQSIYCAMYAVLFSMYTTPSNISHLPTLQFGPPSHNNDVKCVKYILNLIEQQYFKASFISVF